VERLKKSLADWDRKIAQFKVDHLGELPEQLSANMSSFERTVVQIDTTNEALRIADARRSDLAREHAAGDTEAGRLKAAEDGKTEELVAARNMWTEQHPDVQRLSNELEALKAKREDAEGRMLAERAERARSLQVVKEIEARLKILQQQAQAFQKRIDSTPKWAHELSVMDRDYDAVKAKYGSVVSRQVEAELAHEMEIRGAQEWYRILSAAGVPAGAASPNRVVGFFIALLAALGLAALAGLLLELRDESIRDASELKGRLPMPVLAVVPSVPNGKGGRRILRPSSGRNEVVPETLN
jgi:DNA repair exonuclease SbcCD ATPase subunit